MNTYMKNYWSLYLDFIKDFESLKYKGFSLSYLIHLPSLIRNNKNLWESLSNEEFSANFKNQVKNQKQVQSVFNKYVRFHKKRPLVKNKNGKVVINYDTILRFPKKTYQEHFKRSKTMIVMAGVKNAKKKTVHRVAKNVHNLPVKYLSDYPINTRKAIMQVQSRARAIIKSHKGHHLYQDKMFQALLNKKIMETINRIDQSILFLEEVSTSCLILSSTHSYIARILALCAAEKGIPTICMQHGIVGNEFGYIPKIATVDAVYGDFERDWFLQRGAPEGSVEVIGHPRFDQAFGFPNISRSKLYKQLGLDKSKKTIMIVVRGNRNMDKYRLLIKTICQKLDVNILIKDFPGSSPHPLTSEFPTAYSTQSFDLYDLLPHVDCVVSYASTVGLEAMLANKPVFILYTNIPSYSGYYNNLKDLVQSNPQTLGEQVIRYFHDPDCRGYVDLTRQNFLKYAYPDSELSGVRLRKLINRLINQPN
ncbi:hypothetical protein [Sediminibacillus massiliensis]|uniref:hypothetical protein n=1 Tax=Sediminibacillus massiliensis TaxID=1926277 RepID=UPI00098881CD|nr:hypothetical protein [Sediminibacillus massiliensis]